MLRPFSVGLIYGGKSKKYADIMKKLIVKASANYVLTPVLIDDDTLKPGMLIEQVFKPLKTCDFAYIFLSEDYVVRAKGSRKSATEKTMSKQNPILEYGFMLNLFNNVDRLEIIIDFSFSRINNGSYLFPSDLQGLTIFSLVNFAPEEFLDKRLKQLLQSFTPINAEGLLTACPEYIVDYSTLFSNDEIDELSRYSLDYQYQHTLETWISEAEEFDRKGNNTGENKNMFNIQAVFLFERIVFLSIFPSLNKMGSYFDITLKPHSASACQTGVNDQQLIYSLFSSIKNYILHMPGKQVDFFCEQEQIISGLYSQLQQLSLNPIIRIVAQNYIGLCNWNIARQFCDGKATHLPQDYAGLGKDASDYTTDDLIIYIKKCLNKAEAMFTAVIAADEQLGDKLHVFKSFAHFNRGRVRFYLQQQTWNANLKLRKNHFFNSLNNKNKNCCLIDEGFYASDFSMCLDLRASLANNSKSVPEFLRNYFLCERIHSEITWANLCLKRNGVQEETAQKLLRLLVEIYKLDVSPNKEVNLFRNLKTRIKSSLEQAGVDETCYINWLGDIFR